MKLKKEQNIHNELFREYFNNYRSPSDMYEKISKTKGAVNKHPVSGQGLKILT